MMTSENTKMISENTRMFTVRNVVAIAIHVIIASVYISTLNNKVDRLNEITSDIRKKQEMDARDSKTWQTIVETDIATLKVRIAIIEEKLKSSN